MPFLAVLLLAPWLLVLAFCYWYFPRRLPRTAARRVFDGVAVLAAVAVATVVALHASAATVPAATDALGHRSGDIWPQVLSALCAYAGFVIVLALAMLLRARLWRAPR
jgi:hypothetical protein